ncbi:Starch-binding associating with outer membrane [Mucilaginibacter gossypiicola]|uniref:Starch-binding associating with outer membrane n=1 Tax=Mucilaginibacter gossypiicola TaxID=551995 RepID=A0A1H8LNI0_9SPHI|nr:RagB/SusD family nutrient uptake outer membrane protein [Mucilaginibacter gossypiicola]SEO06376.1 Starch-binding associating with outer membrane [Mucilaginibacter gossypiicola]
MKKLRNIIPLMLIAVMAFGVTGCKKYIEESNLGGQTDETYYVTKAGFEDLAKSNYSNLRYIVSNNALYTLGTDIYTSYGITDVNALNIYNVSLNSSIADVDSFWKQLYYSIGTANTTLYWATKVQGMDATALNTRVGESKALRAYYYFLLAETFGDVPLVLTRSTSASVSFSRAPEKDVYTQIITDLTDAIAVLPATTTDFGRVTKGFAQHLLSKVYLTRGYKTYAASTDFSQAATTAEALINSGTYSLKSSYSSLFDPTVANFQVNSEVIFSVQYSTNAATNQVYYLGKVQATAVTGNNLHQNFLWDTQGLSVIGRSSLYNKPNYVSVPDPYFFTLFDKARDSRYGATVWNALIAQSAGTVSGRTFAVGDTVIYYPDAAFTAEQKAAKKYFVFNPDEYHSSPFSGTTRTYPQFKKFRELNLTFADYAGTRDTYVFRLAETYLIAAEAELKAGNTAKALQLYNTIRTRAAITGVNPATGVSYATEMQVTSLSIDDILDERARELAGEEFRWFELKRTGKLISRTLAHNEEAAAANNLKETFLLRPVPQSQIDLNRGASFPQNPGY